MVLVILAGIAAIETANVHVENMSELKQPVEGTRLRIPWVPNATNTAWLKHYYTIRKPAKWHTKR